ncbi:helix-turn-helix domain-containing protein [Pediococcus acidilactici]|uniref:helix-turn-helix domain-containing protein n=1 Tax=Pediococcus acidilactici TaxID=1254 RepID=UPI003908A851
MFTVFLTNRKAGIIKLSHYFNYSQSYCYKLINKANSLLQRLNFKCQINKRLNYLLVEGDENQIRMLTYLLEITANQIDKTMTTTVAVSNQ